MTLRYQFRWTPETKDDAAFIVDWFNDAINAERVIVQLGEKAEACLEACRR